MAEKIDAIEDRYFGPIQKADQLVQWLFYASSFLAVSILFIESTHYPNIFILQDGFVLATAVGFFRNLTLRLYLDPRARKMRLAYLPSNTSAIELSHERTSRYYNNEEQKIFPKLGMQVVEKSWFTQELFRIMCRREGHPERRKVRAGSMACVLLAYCSCAFALEPSLDISQYAHTAWTFRDGFLKGSVYTLAQTADGYLWLGTQTGLFRFDGVHATALPEPASRTLSNTEVGALLPASDGTLWIGTLDGLMSWKNGELVRHPVLGERRVNALLQDRHGTIWVGTTADTPATLCGIRGGSTQCYGVEERLGSIGSLYEDQDGSLWVGSDGGLWRWTPDKPTRYLAARLFQRQTLASGDHGSGLLVALDDLRQVRGDSLAHYPLVGVPRSFGALRILRDRNGGLWIASDTWGLVHAYRGRTSSFGQKDGLSSNQVTSLYEDREGSIWVGTSAGLDRFRELAVTSVSVEDGLSSTSAFTVMAAQDGGVWIGTADGLDRLKDGRVTAYRRRDYPALVNDEIDTLYQDARGRIWVAQGDGLAVLENGKLTAVGSLPVGSKFAITGDNQSGLWLSLGYTSDDEYGLVHLIDGKIVEHAPWKTLTGGGPNLGGLLPDSRGGVWFGKTSGEVAYFHEGQYDNLPVTGGPDSAKFSAGKVLDLSRDADGAFWLATDEGLRRIAGGHAATLSMANGLPCNLVHWIIEDDSASYWLYTRCGLLRIARSEMAAWIADPRRKIGFTTFDASDGVRLVPALSGYRPQVAKSADGRIWFINFDTLSYFDPSRMAVNALPPPVRIERLTADRKGYDAAAELRLPALVRDISVDYTALSLVAPEKMHFRYKLEGQDLDWREVVNDREARYSNLPPATYRFRVIASNNSGVWNEEGASLQFSIAPAYWQTTWFRLLCGAACLGLLVLLYWLRVRQLAIQFNMKLDARVGERTRIARELHDTMLQSFQGVLLQLQAALRFLSKDPRKTEKILVEVIDQAAEAIKGGREAVQGLRASTQQSNDLAAAIASVGREMFARRGGNNVPALRVEVEGVARDLHPIIRDEIFRVVAEALRNALQHSCGTQVEVQLWYGPREFRVRVRDDGQGIDQKILADGGVEGHFGLGGMRERATLIGAKLTVWSALGSGTEVELVIAESKAYQSAIVRDRSK